MRVCRSVYAAHLDDDAVALPVVRDERVGGDHALEQRVAPRLLRDLLVRQLHFRRNCKSKGSKLNL